MKRPTSRRDQNESTGRTVTSDTPLNALIEKLVRLMERPPRPSLEIRNTSRAQREWKIVEVLCSIDLTQSRLPIEILNKKSDPDQSVPDIEMYIFLARNMIRDNEQDYTGINTAYIEACIIEIAKLAKQAIESGSPKAAEVACRGLLTAIGDIRNKIPSVYELHRCIYINQAAKHLEELSDYIKSNFALDCCEKNAEDLRADIGKKTDELNAEIGEFSDRMTNDEALRAMIEDIRDEKISGDRTPELEDVYNRLIERRKAALSIARMKMSVDTCVMKCRRLTDYLNALDDWLSFQFDMLISQFGLRASETEETDVLLEDPDLLYKCVEHLVRTESENIGRRCADMTWGELLDETQGVGSGDQLIETESGRLQERIEEFKRSLGPVTDSDQVESKIREEELKRAEAAIREEWKNKTFGEILSEELKDVLLEECGVTWEEVLNNSGTSQQQ